NLGILPKKSSFLVFKLFLSNYTLVNQVSQFAQFICHAVISAVAFHCLGKGPGHSFPAVSLVVGSNILCTHFLDLPGFFFPVTFNQYRVIPCAFYRNGCSHHMTVYSHPGNIPEMKGFSIFRYKVPVLSPEFNMLIGNYQYIWSKRVKVTVEHS